MKYVIDIPNHLEQALEQQASATGEEIEELIRMAVVTAEILAPCDLRRDVSRPIPVETSLNTRVK